MIRLNCFGKFNGYYTGGAERSMYFWLQRQQNISKQITITSIGNKNLTKRYSNVRWKSIKDYEQVEISLPLVLIKYFPYTDYMINRKRIINHFKSLNGQIRLVAYSIYAPAAIIGSKVPSDYFVRSNQDLGEYYCNNSKGFKKMLMYGLMALEYIGYSIYKKDLKNSMKRVTNVYTNSDYMSRKVYDMYGRSSTKYEPFIDINLLRANFNHNRLTRYPKGIVFIDGGVEKGRDIVQKLIKDLPNRQFHIFSKSPTSIYNQINVQQHGWVKDISDVYSLASIVLVPSYMGEAFGRVGREASLLNIPVLVSDNGGLPESVFHRHDSIIRDFRNPDAWKNRILSIFEEIR